MKPNIKAVKPTMPATPAKVDPMAGYGEIIEAVTSYMQAKAVEDEKPIPGESDVKNALVSWYNGFLLGLGTGPLAGVKPTKEEHKQYRAQHKAYGRARQNELALVATLGGRQLAIGKLGKTRYGKLDKLGVPTVRLFNAQLEDVMDKAARVEWAKEQESITATRLAAVEAE